MHLKAKTLCTYLSIDSFEASGMGAGQLLSILTFGFGVAVGVNNVHVTNWLTTPIYIVFRADYRCHDYKRVEMAAQTSFHIQIGSFVSSRCTAEVAMHTKITPQPLPVTLLFTMSLKVSGPNRSTATELKIGPGPILISFFLLRRHV